jgi:hypothetical protein
MKPHAEISRPTVPNARFWTFENDSWVKVTLRVGQTLDWGRTSRDEEGASFAACRWTHQGAGVRLDWQTGGRDCDGYSESAGSVFAPVGLLAVCACGYEAPEQHGGRTMLRPDWQRVGDTVRRDDSAEAAGY